MVSPNKQVVYYMDNLRPCDVLVSTSWGRIPVYARESVPNHSDLEYVLIWIPAKPALLRADNLVVSLKDGNLCCEFGKVNLLICHGGSKNSIWCPEHYETSFMDILSGIPKNDRKTIEAIIACNPARQVLPTSDGFHDFTYCLGSVSSSVKLEREKLVVSAKAEELISKGEPH